MAEQNTEPGNQSIYERARALGEARQQAGRCEQVLAQVRDVGKQLAAQGVKAQEAGQQSSPVPRRPEQSAGDAVRHRQILDKQQNGLVNSGRGAPPAASKDVAAVAKSKSIVEAAKSLRESGVSGRAANEVGRAKDTPAVHQQQQSRGRGR